MSSTFPCINYLITTDSINSPCKMWFQAVEKVHLVRKFVLIMGIVVKRSTCIIASRVLRKGVYRLVVEGDKKNMKKMKPLHIFCMHHISEAQVHHHRINV